jgi:hypothetical protein
MFYGASNFCVDRTYLSEQNFIKIKLTAARRVKERGFLSRAESRGSQEPHLS